MPDFMYPMPTDYTGLKPREERCGARGQASGLTKWNTPETGYKKAGYKNDLRIRQFFFAKKHKIMQIDKSYPNKLTIDYI